MLLYISLATVYRPVWEMGGGGHTQDADASMRHKTQTSILLLAIRKWDEARGVRRLSNTCLFSRSPPLSRVRVVNAHIINYEQMWPPLHILSFWLLPKHWRPLTSHLAGVALLAVISSTGLTDAELPLGQRAVPLMMRWAREAADAVGERVRGNGRRVSGAPRST